MRNNKLSLPLTIYSLKLMVFLNHQIKIKSACNEDSKIKLPVDRKLTEGWNQPTHCPRWQGKLHRAPFLLPSDRVGRVGRVD